MRGRLALGSVPFSLAFSRRGRGGGGARLRRPFFELLAKRGLVVFRQADPGSSPG